LADERKDTQCIAGGPYCEIFFDFNEDNFQLWDKTKNDSPSRLSMTSYQNVAYVHSGWYTEDKQVVLVHDELDEMDYNLNTTVRLFELSDLRNPYLLSTWSGPTGAIDHNGFVRGNRYYMSNYTRGMTVLDISNTADPKEVGYFDTFPVSDNTSFNGAWGVYPYLPSGVVLISDISSGLYVVRDNTLDSDQGTVSFDKPKYQVSEGQTLEIQVARQNGSEGAVSVKWELLAGATDGDDLTIDSGVLNWSSGETQVRSINIPILSDSVTESKESFFIRLHDPRGSLSLKSPSISVVSIIANQGTGTVNQAPTVDAGGNISVSAGDSVSLQGTITDEDSTEWSYAWEQLSGTNVSISAADTLTAQFTAPSSEAELTFQLTVTDDAGAVGSDTTEVDVSSPPPAVVTSPSTSSGGGGCTLGHSESRDASMSILLVALILILLRRRRAIG
jgi:hypothetical protein